MKAKLTPDICYLAGLVSKSKGKEKSEVVINTGIDEIEQRFIEIAVKELEIDPTKIVIEQSESRKYVKFYHSRVSKMLKDIAAREVYLFKKKDDLAASYIAGMFDSAGHIRGAAPTISPLTPTDAFMLENLGIHTRGNEVINITNFILLVKGRSIIIDKNSSKF
ncbi:MAG: hypothetical protein KGH64_00540 [Candidatus Micrarchaeota archaeon]|nr:hypothetical protein [Candidatus Micrarchaeota archaeon]MDE1859586.1 hypothetical protein [Candidatus Micrarchaeota archaeon]